MSAVEPIRPGTGGDRSRRMSDARGSLPASRRVRTATRFQNTARGRAAHPGIHAGRHRSTLKGLHKPSFEVAGEEYPSGEKYQTLSGFGEDRWSCDPGCAARRWAVLFNAFGVVRVSRPVRGRSTRVRRCACIAAAHGISVTTWSLVKFWAVMTSMTWRTRP